MNRIAVLRLRQNMKKLVLISGTTTQEMEASIDIVLCDESIHVISDVINAVLGREEYLIHYLHTTPQGYCVLRPMREDAGIPVKDISPKKVNEYNLYGGVVCLTHDRLFPKENGNMGKRQGLVIQSYDESENFVENITNALCLPKMPKDLLKGWIERVQNKMWPREDQMEAILQSELLLVPVGHKKSKSPYIEFRFSFIQAERILMFDLNITQVRCLTLMKILMKTYIDQSFEDGVNKIIPSYFCKTALLYTIEETGNKGWGQYNLLMHTETCLKWILRHIAGNKVPHYFLPDIDLLEGDFDEEIRLETAHKLSTIIASPQSAISQLTIDDIGLRYLQKNAQMIRKILKPPGQIKYEILNYHVNHHMFRFLTEFNRLVYAGLSQHDLNYNVKMVNNALVECKKISKTGDDEVLQTILLIRPMLCTVLGCLLGSQNTSRQLVKTLRALDWLLIGKESDLMSGRLKLASAYYCYGEYGRAEELLDEIEDDFDKDYVLKVCGCRYHTRYEITRGFNDGCFYYINENILHKQSAYCVVFTRCEKPWVPIQFQNEMYRSSPKELKRRKAEDHWMDWACIDSYPYLYFLQYLNYEALRDRKASVKAFHALVEVTESEQWYHTETIFNLLGQCYEKENMKEKAHEYYKKSSEIMPNNNAAIKLKRKLRSNLK